MCCLALHAEGTQCQINTGTHPTGRSSSHSNEPVGGWADEKGNNRLSEAKQQRDLLSDCFNYAGVLVGQKKRF